MDNNTAGYNDYFRLLEQLGGILDSLTGIAREKIVAVRKDDLAGVDACMKREQVLSLSLRSCEKKREKLLRDLGMENVPLSRLAESCPEELRLEAKAAAEKLRARYTLYRSAENVARSTLECNLHQIEKMLENRLDTPMNGGTVADIRA